MQALALLPRSILAALCLTLSTPLFAAEASPITLVEKAAAVYDHILTRTQPNGEITGVRVGPKDANRYLTFTTATLNQDKTATLYFDRHDAFGDSRFKMTLLTKDDHLLMDMVQVDNEGPSRYDITIVTDSHVKWTPVTVDIGKNEHTDAAWEIEIANIDIYLNDDARTIYQITNSRYTVDEAYALSQYDVSEDHEGTRYLIDRTTGKTAALTLVEVDALISKGLVTLRGDAGRVVTWVQLAP